MRGKRSRFVLTCLCFGFAFLYLPILLMMFYSFNHSRLLPVWGGFSTRWYHELFNSPEIWSATLLSLKIAAITATVATVFGTLAGIAIARFRSFRGRTLFTGMITAPLVMPEVITGLSLLLLFITLQQIIGWPAKRGMTTITIAHITFAMAYVAIIIQSRLSDSDMSLEEAAYDLGARPFRVLYDITLPLLAPGMMAGWLLAFTLSLDDLIISSFVAGPGSTTLPMLIYSRIRLGLKPDINALATVLIGVVALGVLISWLILLRQHRRKAAQSPGNAN